MQKPKEKIGSILLVRSAPIERTINVLERLRKEYPNTEISILVQPEVKNKIKVSGLVDRVIIGKTGRISLLKYLSIIHRLRREKFDLLVLVYTEDMLCYTNVRLFASLLKADERIGITAQDTLEPFGIKDVLKDLMLKNLFMMIIVMPLFLTLMILVFVAIFFYNLRKYLGRSKVLFL